MSKPLNDIQMAAFAKDLAMMLAAGITPADGLASLIPPDCPADQKEGWQIMSRSLAKGRTLAESFTASGLLTPYFCAMTAVATQAGRLEETMYKLAAGYQHQADTKSRLRDMVIRPLILFVFLGLIMIFIILAVMPVFSSVYQRLGGYQTGFVTAAYILAYIGLGVIIIMAAALAAAGFGSRRLAIKFFENSALTRRAARLAGQAEMFGVIDTLIAGGQSPEEALRQAEPFVRRPDLSEALKQCRQLVAAGENIGMAMDKTGLVETSYAHVIYTASRTGQLDQAISQTDQRLAALSNAALDEIIDNSEPLITGIFTIVIGLTLLAVMLPLIAVITSIG